MASWRSVFVCVSLSSVLTPGCTPPPTTTIRYDPLLPFLFVFGLNSEHLNVCSSRLSWVDPRESRKRGGRKNTQEMRPFSSQVENGARGSVLTNRIWSRVPLKASAIFSLNHLLFFISLFLFLTNKMLSLTHVYNRLNFHFPHIVIFIRFIYIPPPNIFCTFKRIYLGISSQDVGKRWKKGKIRCYE